MSAPHPLLFTPRAIHMNFQVPSYLPSIRPGYSLFLLKIQRIFSIFWFDAVYRIRFCLECLKCVYNARNCFPHVQTIYSTPIKVFLLFTSSFKNGGHFWQKWQKRPKMTAILERRNKNKKCCYGYQRNRLDIRIKVSIIINAFMPKKMRYTASD
jgi:hypothetical protein